MHEATLLFPILVGTLALFIWGYWRYDVVACIALMACIAVGAVPYSLAFSGFSNPAVITVACVMVITEAIKKSGVVDYLVQSFTPVTSVAWLHIATLTVLVALLSAFMNNVAALALMMPVAIQTAMQAKRSPSIVLMPLALGSALGGLTTLIGTPPNLLISNVRMHTVGKPFEMFDFAPVGIVCAVLGIIFIAVVGWRMMPIRRATADQSEDIFQIEDYITEVHIPEKSVMVGKTVADLEDLIEGDITVFALIRNDRKRLVFPRDEQLVVDDILIIEANHADLEKLLRLGKLDLVGVEKISKEILRSDRIAVIEAVIPPGTRLEGRTAKSMRLRSRYRINILAISRQGKSFKQRLRDVKLKAGDVVMVQGDSETLRDVTMGFGLLPLVERGVLAGMKRSALLPLLIFGIAIALATLSIIPVQIAFGGAVVSLLVFQVLPVREMYTAIEWPVIVLLGAMIPVGDALQFTGGTELIANGILGMSAQFPLYVILALLMVVTIALSSLMNNAATAVVMAPIAVSIAKALGLNVDPFLMTVAIGASCSFLTPIGHQNNILVMGPGGYHFSDYFKIGLVLELLIIAVSLPMILWVWPV